MKKNNTTNEKLGSALLLSSVLLFVVLSMVVTLTYVTVMEQGMSQKTKSTVGAFFNADSGIEWALNKIATLETGVQIGDHTAFNDTDPGDGIPCPVEIGGCVVYLLDEEGKVITEGTKHISDIKAVRAVGKQEKGQPTQRAIEAVVAEEDEYLSEGSAINPPDDFYTIQAGAYNDSHPVPTRGIWYTYDMPPEVPISAKGVILKVSINDADISGTMSFRIRKNSGSVDWYLLNIDSSALSVDPVVSSVGFFPIDDTWSIQYRFDHTASMSVNGGIKLSLIGYVE